MDKKKRTNCINKAQNGSKKKRPNCINKDQNGSKKNKLYPLRSKWIKKEQIVSTRLKMDQKRTKLYQQRSKWINRITEIRIQNVISDGYKIFATAKSFLGNVEEF